MVMGIVNVTPDSFFQQSRVNNNELLILKRAAQILEEGGRIIDIGGYSTRPGAAEISVREETERVVPAIKLIKKEFPASIISIDTFRSDVAKSAVEAGADMVNDVSGGRIDDKMFDTVAQLKVPYILMHMRGTPQTMQSFTDYPRGLIIEMLDYFAERIQLLTQKGVNDVIIDPGFGFSKTLEQNYELFRQMDALRVFEKPLLVGISRKSMIYKVLGKDAEESLTGTNTLNTIALQKGASILRVHDVKDAMEVIKLSSLAF